MKHILSILVMLLVCFVTQAQQKPIMVCNAAGTNCAQHLTLDAAVTASSSGDFIYLPGGTFTLSIPIDKPLHLIGAGHNPDSSAVTGTTAIAGNLVINALAEGSSFEGFLLTGNINAGNANSDILRNCIFLKLMINGDYRALSINSQFFQCIFKNYVLCLNAGNGSLPNEANGVFQNCSFDLYLAYWNNSIVSNCLFHASANNFYSCGYITIKNSVFIGQFGSIGQNLNSNIISTNNLYQSDGGNNSYIVNNDNILYTSCGDHFASCPSGYSYSANYKLKAGSTAIGAGTDGKDIGLYGGDMPWGEGSIPGNPHFYFKNIGAATNGAGHLPVNLKVRAQQN